MKNFSNKKIHILWIMVVLAVIVLVVALLVGRRGHDNNLLHQIEGDVISSNERMWEDSQAIAEITEKWEHERGFASDSFAEEHAEADLLSEIGSPSHVDEIIFVGESRESIPYTHAGTGLTFAWPYFFGDVEIMSAMTENPEYVMSVDYNIYYDEYNTPVSPIGFSLLKKGYDCNCVLPHDEAYATALHVEEGVAHVSQRTNSHGYMYLFEDADLREGATGFNDFHNTSYSGHRYTAYIDLGMDDYNFFVISIILPSDWGIEDRQEYKQVLLEFVDTVRIISS